MFEKIKKISLSFDFERVAISILLVVLSLLIFIDTKYTDLGFLQLHSIDEYVFHASLVHMLEGLRHAKFSSLFGFGFYQYGFNYFLLNLLITMPAFLFGQSSWTIFLPRLVSSLSAVFSLYFVYKIMKSWSDRYTAGSLMVGAALMPALWINAAYFHPDWIMTLALLISVYFLSLTNGEVDKNYWRAVVFYGLSVSLKYQIITFLPLFFIFIFYRELSSLEFKNFKNNILIFLKSVGLIAAVFLVNNPYILHPFGWQVFKSSLVGNLASNATNHGSVQSVTILDKLSSPIGFYFLNIPFFLFLTGLAFFYSYKFFKEKNRGVLNIVALTFLINLFYLLFFVNKAWNHYYLPVFYLGIIILSPFFNIFKNNKFKYTILALIVVLQLLLNFKNIIWSVNTSHDYFNPDFNDWSLLKSEENNSFIVDSLQKFGVTSTSTVLIPPYTAFSFEKIGLGYDNVQIFFGCFGPDVVDKNAYVDSQFIFWGGKKSRGEIAKSFKAKDFVVLRKNLPFIQLSKLDKILDKEVCLKTNNMVSKMLHGLSDYNLVAENSDLYIFKIK